MYLTVTCNNDTAVTFYRSLGFSFTGRTEPYPERPRPVRARDEQGNPSLRLGWDNALMDGAPQACRSAVGGVDGDVVGADGALQFT